MVDGRQIDAVTFDICGSGSRTLLGWLARPLARRRFRSCCRTTVDGMNTAGKSDFFAAHVERLRELNALVRQSGRVVRRLSPMPVRWELEYQRERLR